MRLAIYGGSFNPPHLGHMAAARAVAERLEPDRFLIIPTNVPPHKQTDILSPDAEERLKLCRLAFGDIPGAELSDMEMRRSGKSYTADTVAILRETYPEDELYLVVGTDMFLSFRSWRSYRELLSRCTLAVLSRDCDDKAEILAYKDSLERDEGARVLIIEHEPLPMSSADIRALLKKGEGAELLDGRVYGRIIQKRFYGARPQLSWLEQAIRPYLDDYRYRHSLACRRQAELMAGHWGVDVHMAAEAALLHDITKCLKGEKQLLLCEEYGIILHIAQRENTKLLHAMTGAVMAERLFGSCREVCEAIRWHTTGKPDMSTLEKIIYLADVTEDGRSFEGVDKLRQLCLEDIDKAMKSALELSLRIIRERGEEPFVDSLEAYDFYNKLRRISK